MLITVLIIRTALLKHVTSVQIQSLTLRILSYLYRDEHEQQRQQE